MTDLTRLAQINAQLGDTIVDERMFGQIIDSLPSGLLVIDEAHRIRLVNREIELMFGYPRTTLIGEQVHMLLPEAKRSIHAEHIARFFNAPVSRPMAKGAAFDGRHRHGHVVRCQISIGPVVSDDGVFALAVVRRADSGE